MPSWGEVRRWRVEPLTDALATLTRDLAALRESRDLMLDAVPDSWRGRAARAGRRRQRLLLDDIDEQVRQRRALRRALAEAEHDLGTIERGCADAEERAYRLGVRIDDDSSIHPIRTGSTASAAQVEELRDDVARLLRRAARVDDLVTAGVPRDVVAFEREFGGPDPTVARAWRALDPAQRRRVVRALVERLAREAGVPVPRVRIASLDGGYSGYWHEQTRTLSLDPDVLASVYALNIVVHEMRHARQFEAIDDLADGHGPGPDPFDEHERDGITVRQTRRWAAGFADYVDLADDAEAYRAQPVERDARRAGRDYLESLTPARFEALLRSA